MAGLRLDSFAEAAKDRGRGAALVPGEPESSQLYARVTSENDAVRMPPAYSNRELTADQIRLIEKWIAQGGEYSRHWAFTPPRRPEQPKVSDPGWVKQPIDAFVLARLDAQGLRPSSEASPRAWLRRVSLDLTGLPPTLDQLRAFETEAQQGEARYESAIDRLLASPRYGERMAMDWLDVARYADTHGFNNDSSRSMWRWRDWVIDSFNANLPYDRFITEQLAGDLLPSPTLEQRIATGFNRNHVINSEGGIIDEEYRVEYVADRVRTVSMAWMGLSFECARCHDHKYDPISQRDYYRLFAFFDTVPEAGEAGRVANATPMISAPTLEQRSEMAGLEARIAELQHEVQLERESMKSLPSNLRKAAKRARERAPKTEPALAFPCDDAGTAGIVREACRADRSSPVPEAKIDEIKLEDDSGFVLALWLEPTNSKDDQPVFSAIDYAPDPGSAKHGQGIELRLVDGEIELRMSQRAPVYSITVRSDGAAIESAEWTHVAAVYEGRRGDPAMRAKAAWVRLFVDGIELPTSIVYDDLPYPLPSFEPPLRLGWNNERSNPRYDGLIDEVTLWPEPLSAAEISDLFYSQAIPFATERAADGTASVREADWLRRFESARRDARFTKLQRLRARLFELRRQAPTVMVMQEMDDPRETHLLQRGMYNLPGEVVEPGVPAELLGDLPDGAPPTRLGLARWLTRPDHPLTARVVVNRFWQQLFGIGLVKTSENVGLQGDSPSHPELLDWLATELIRSGWDVKALLRQIVLSAAYRQSSAVTPDLLARDPENRLLARGPRFRLPAEIIRDQALALAGLLANRSGGPSVRPYQPAGLYNGVVVGTDYPGTTWEPSEGDDLYRRSLYTFWKRTVPHPTMTVFDAPDREVCTVRRSTTNTPLQALTLMNDPIFVEAARKLAERVMLEGGDDSEVRIAYLFELATGRAAAADERALLQRSFDDLSASYSDDEEAAEMFLRVGASPRDPRLSARELAVYTALASIVLNLDEVVTRG